VGRIAFCFIIQVCIYVQFSVAIGALLPAECLPSSSSQNETSFANSCSSLKHFDCLPFAIYIYIYITYVMITNSKIADKNISHFTILVNHSRPKYIDNMK
jgi:hypothetical protein